MSKFRQTKYKFVDEGRQHLHTYNGKPLIGTTSCVTEVLKPPLAWYGSGKAVELFGARRPKELTLLKNGKLPEEEAKLLRTDLVDAHSAIKGLDEEGYLELVMKAYANHNEYKDTRAEEGEKLHSTLESYVTRAINEFGGVPFLEKDADERVNKFIAWAIEFVDKFLYSECYCYSEEMWMGGKFDVIFKGKDEKTYLGDFKSAKASYHSNWIQMAFYDLQIQENGILTSEGVRLDMKILEAKDEEGEVISKLKFDPDVLSINGYALFPFGGKVLPDFRYNLEDYRRAAEGVLENYKLSQIQ